ncbi:hypothetical protein WKI27_11935 [Brevundimonas vesicularis]|uniref:hypothetical protein n=1 Tax=Brevundimonas vesicularis TaxID=41276 RepID=UPI0030BAEED0
MTELDGRSSDDEIEYFSISEEALEHLPAEWREAIEVKAADGRAVLRSVDKELSALSRLSISAVTMVSLKHVQRRLSAYKFKPTLEAFLELEMLTTAFVVTYVRLHEGGGGSGFARNMLPEALRPIHDEILEMRNKRFAHQDGHASIADAMQIAFDDDAFELKLGLQLGYHVGGRLEWPHLVKFIDAMLAERLSKLQVRLAEKTGRPWIFPTGPAPDEPELD